MPRPAPVGSTRESGAHGRAWWAERRTRSRGHRLALTAAAVLMAGASTSCTSFVTGMGQPAAAGLERALQGGIDGFRTGAAPALPEAICRDGGGSRRVPVVDRDLGPPVSAGYRSGRAELFAWAWTTDSPQAAADVLTTATRTVGNCAYDLHVDAHTDGDGRPDAGASITENARPYDRYGWTGVAVSTERNGQPDEEIRFVRLDEVVLLAMLTGSGTTGASPAVDSYLAVIAGELG